MGDCFIFKPCKNEDSFKLIPKCEIKKRDLIKKIFHNFNAKLLADTGFITVIEIDGTKLTINRKGEIIIRGASEEQVKNIAAKLLV